MQKNFVAKKIIYHKLISDMYESILRASKTLYYTSRKHNDLNIYADFCLGRMSVNKARSK